MAELTIDQALQKGVEAHMKGQLQEADRLYTAIIKAQPKHPDANHNIGVLAVGMGEVEQALPFLKTALEAAPAKAQFWLSYIDALIKLSKLAEAKAVLDQAKSKGAKGGSFDKLGQSLQEVGQDPPQDQLQPLVDLYIRGELYKSIEGVDQLLQRFPNSITLLNIQGASNAGLGNFGAAMEAYNKALVIKPDYAQAYFNKGLSLQDQGKLEEAIEAYCKGLAIKPDHADAYYNMGNALKRQGQLEGAKEAYNKALAIKPDYAEAYNNMGVTLQEQGKLEKAIEAYNKALAIKPDNADTYNNIGVTLREQDKLEQAIEAYNRALAIKPDYAEAKYNLAETLKVYSPKNRYVNQLIDIDSKIKTKHNKHELPKADRELAIFTSDLLNELKSADKNLSTQYLQIYRRNNIDLNCKRHKGIFKEKKIIPKFCFGCYKVQVEVTTVLDLIRLAKLFYALEFESDLTRKCLVEVRPNISGFYKGLIYCRGIDQAHIVKKQLDVHVKDIDENLIAKIKKGCSEFPLVFPKYGEVGAGEEEMMQFPQEWQALETDFDAEHLITPKTHLKSSLKEFCLSDYLIIQKWIDYAKGIGDPTSKLFCGIPIKYKEIWEIANARIK